VKVITGFLDQSYSILAERKEVVLFRLEVGGDWDVHLKGKLRLTEKQNLATLEIKRSWGEFFKP